jgi:tripartite-type tricarboxylate transporter receptor subunit TctC
MLSRRRILQVGGAAACAPMFAGAAGAQDAWPSREIHTICPFPAGSGADVVVRYYAKVLQDSVGKTVVVENRPGAFGNIATEAIARSKPDGYTVGIVASSAIAAAPALFKTLSYDPVKDFDQVTSLMRVPWFLLVAADSPYKTVADLTDYLKKQGDKGSYASVANSGVISSELYKLAFGLQTVEVKYRDPFLMLNDLYAGNVAFAHLDAATTIGSVKNGKLRILTSSTKERAKAFPDVPSAAESGINSNVWGWWSIAMPKGSPQAIRDRLEKLYGEFVPGEEHTKWALSIGCEPYPGNAAATQAALLKEIDAWHEYVRIAKIEKI